MFWNAEGVLLMDFLPHKVTVTWLFTLDLLHKLRVTIKTKCREKLTHVPLLVHDNAIMHLLTSHCSTLHHTLLIWH